MTRLNSRSAFISLSFAIFFCSVSLRSQTTPPKISPLAANRLLQQASWGPTPDSLSRLQNIGIDAWINEQFATPASNIPDIPPDDKGRHPIAPMQQMFLSNAVNAPDQLRQRVAWALSQIWVVSALKLNDASQILPYWRLLQQDAFSNFRQIMLDITLSPAMGHYLDMVNNDKPNAAKGTGANENYARELLQLFTIGLDQLNPDGTYKLDTAGQRIPTYSQDTIEGFARAFTGWTYAPIPGATPRAHNPANYAAPMAAYEANHDTGEKVLLNGGRIAAGGSATADLNAALDNIFQHPNVGPFISRQLIQHLVTSSPSPSYVQRVAAVFANNGFFQRGDMAAVIKAILTDPEARQGDAGSGTVSAQHLKEPVLFITAVLRALNSTVTNTNGLPGQASNMGQNPFYSPSVFNYFPPDYEIAGTNLNAPEFGIYSPATSMLRLNFLNSLIFNRNIAGVTTDLTPWVQLASNPQKLLDAVNMNLYAGSMPAAVRTSIMSAVTAATTPTTKAQTALYLAAAANMFSVAQ